MSNLKRILIVLGLVLGVHANATESILVAGKFPDGVFPAEEVKTLPFTKVPEKLDELQKYQVLILAPDRTRSVLKANTLLSKAQSEAIREYVIAGGVLLVTGGKHILAGFEPIPPFDEDLPILAEAPIREILPVSPESAMGAYSRFQDYARSYFGPGFKGNYKLFFKPGYPEFARFRNPALVFKGYNITELRPETQTVGYTKLAWPHYYGHKERAVFAFAGRRGAFMLPVTGISDSAKCFELWSKHVEFLKTCVDFLRHQAAGAFIGNVEVPKKLLTGKTGECEISVCNAEKTAGEYDLGYQLIDQELLCREPMLRHDAVARILLNSGENRSFDVPVLIPANFGAAPGKYRLVFTLRNVNSGEFVHSKCKDIIISQRRGLELNPGEALSFTDRTEAELKVVTKGAEGETLSVKVSHNCHSVLAESRTIKTEIERFTLKTSDLPYGEYHVDLCVSDGEKLVARRTESIFLGPEYEKNDFRLGMVAWYWRTHRLNRQFVKNMRRLGMSICRGNFGIWDWLEKNPPVFKNKKTGDVKSFEELLKKQTLTVSRETGEIILKDPDLIMERQFDFSYYLNWPMPDYLRYGMDVIQMVGSSTCWNKNAPIPWINKLFSIHGQPMHYQVNNKGNYVKKGTYVKVSPAFKPLVKLEQDYMSAVASELDKKYSSITPAYQVQNETALLFNKNETRDFNPANLRAFQAWLQNKYRKLNEFNRLAGSDFKSWSEIEPSRQVGKLGATPEAAILAEFKAYEDEMLADWISDCAAGIKRVAPEKMCGVNYVHWIEVERLEKLSTILCSDNYFALASRPNIDYLGISNYNYSSWDNSLLYDTQYAAGRPYGKFGWITEGGNFYRLSPGQLEEKSWRAIFHGIRTHVYFAHRFHKVETPSHMFNFDGSINERSRGVGRAATFVRNNCYLVRGSVPHGQKTGLLVIPKASYLAFAETGEIWPHSSMIALYQMLNTNNLPVRMLDPSALLRGDLKDLKAIVVPDFKFGLSDQHLKAIKQFFDAGGEVVTFGRFGLQNDWFKAAAGPEILSSMGIDIDGERQNSPVVKVKVGKNDFYGEGYQPVKIDENKGNEVLGTLNGKPAIVVHRNSNTANQWLYIGVNPPKGPRRATWTKFLGDYLLKRGVVRPVSLRNAQGEEQSMERYVMRNPNNKAYFIWSHNRGDKIDIAVTVPAPDLEKAAFYDFSSQKYLPTKKNGDLFKTNYSLPKNQSMILGLLPEGVDVRQSKIPVCRPAFARQKVEEQGKGSERTAAGGFDSGKLGEANYPEAKVRRIVSAPSAEGFIRDWDLIGPFANPPGLAESQGADDIFGDGGGGEDRGYGVDFLHSFGGEVNPKTSNGAHVFYSFPMKGRKKMWMDCSNFDKLKLSWRDYSSKSNFVNLGELFSSPKEYTVAYATCILRTPTAREVIVRVGSDDGYKLWVNGRFIAKNIVKRGATPDSESYLIPFQRYNNRIVFKIGQDRGGFGFYFRITDINGKPITDMQVITQASEEFEDNEKNSK